jgi:hypothetical protein
MGERESLFGFDWIAIAVPSALTSNPDWRIQ